MVITRAGIDRSWRVSFRREPLGKRAEDRSIGRHGLIEGYGSGFWVTGRKSLLRLDKRLTNLQFDRVALPLENTDHARRA
jgi:hypothetical protein